MRWLLALVACSARLVDPCAGLSGTCVALYVDASPPIDALAIHVTGVKQQTQTSHGLGLTSPPIAIALVIDNSFIDPGGSQLSFDVSGEKGGDGIAAASTSVHVTRGSHTNVHVRLTVPDLGSEADLTTPANADLSGVDLSGVDLAGVDFSGADLSVVDLATAPPACTDSSTCPASAPICDSTALTCRACSGAAEDATCLQRSTATPHCKLTGANSGTCVACNVDGDCAMAAPVCSPDGSCRKCQSHSECASEICDFTSGSCAAQSDIIYVDASNDSGQNSCSETAKDGSLAAPFCEISKAISLLGVSTRHFVHLAPSDNNYAGFNLPDTMGRTITFVGPGKDAAKKATFSGAQDVDVIVVHPTTGGQAASVVLDGLNVLGNANSNLLVCDSANSSTPDLTVTNSSFANTNRNGVEINKCKLSLSRSYVSGAAGTGVFLGNASSYVVQNVFVWGCAAGVEFDSSNGAFSFNTLAFNTGTIGIFCEAPSIVVADSIVFGNHKDGPGSQFQFGGGGAGCTLINVVTGTDSIADPGKITAAPVLKSMTDLHLDTSAANLAANQACCIDRVSAAGPSPSPSPLPALDIDGSARPKGAHWDIGAHEAL